MDTAAQSPSHTDVVEIGSALYQAAARSRPAFFRTRGVHGAALSRALEDEALRRALFQFVDVLPQLSDRDAIATHFKAYLHGHSLAGAWGRLLTLGQHPFLAWAVRSSVSRMARLFLVEERRTSIGRVLRELAAEGATATIDAVGEAVLTDGEAESYVQRYRDVLSWQSVSGWTPHASLKLSGLTPRFDPIDPRGAEARVLARLESLMRQIIELGATLTIDMESYDVKPLVLRVFRAIVDAYPEPAWRPAIALQAYLRETERDVAELIGWARSRGRRISVRLVKGAYWDTEVALARQRNWPVPVFLDKAETDLNFERLTRTLFDARDVIYPAIAGHNLRSLAHAIAAARERGMDRADWEIQMLYGMAEPLQRAIAQHGVALRVYVPTGELVTGIAYLIRRLLENTASSSILRQTYIDGHATDALLAPPCPGAQAPARKQTFTFSNTPLLDFSRADEREQFARALSEVRSQLGRRYGLRIDGGQQSTDSTLSTNPARSSEVLGTIQLTDAAGATRAIANAKGAFPGWRERPAADRIALSRRAARLIEARRRELAAWEVLEQGKNWREADADVAEAIDYFYFYASEMQRLDGWRPTMTFPGETNVTRFEARGVAVIISPWNFPLAILAGMTSAALVSGNCAIMKPAMPALIVAHLLHSILLEAGFPPDVCQLVPGRGSVIGDVLVDHPDVQLIAFTGSREVGLRILERSAKAAPDQLHVKRVVCEMGGKNAIIVDDDANLDEAVHQTLYSAFGYQGQKCSACSRVIALGAVHDRFVERLTAALDAYAYGPPEDPQFIFGPLIACEARQKVLDYVEIGGSEGRLVYKGRVPDGGHYAPPAIFTEIRPHHRLAQDEIFGPVLAVLRASTFDEALDIALDSRYALTGGVFSRLPDHLARARERFRVGDLYLNRRITGARVGAQPFGGYRLSGMGIPAGGDEYLKQFMWSRVVTENTIRHGYVP